MAYLLGVMTILPAAARRLLATGWWWWSVRLKEVTPAGS